MVPRAAFKRFALTGIHKHDQVMSPAPGCCHLAWVPPLLRSCLARTRHCHPCTPDPTSAASSILVTCACTASEPCCSTQQHSNAPRGCCVRVTTVCTKGGGVTASTCLKLRGGCQKVRAAQRGILTRWGTAAGPSACPAPCRAAAAGTWCLPVRLPAACRGAFCQALQEDTQTPGREVMEHMWRA